MKTSRADPAFPVLLAIATSTERCTVALSLADSEQPTRRISVEAENGSRGSGSILQLIEHLLAQAGTGREAIDAIAFDRGPGAFTGVRLGCSVAQGLGFALNRPLIAVSSLEVIAAAAVAALKLDSRPLGNGSGARRLIWSATDARMQEVYCSAYRCDGETDLELSHEAIVASAGSVCEVISAISKKWQPGRAELANGESSAATLVAAGNAFERFSELAACAQYLGMSVQASAWPNALQLAEVAERHWRAKRMIQAQQAEPLYIRNKVALNVDEQRKRG